jgi:uncharacterized protein YebE (UPF0316 family)
MLPLLIKIFVAEMCVVTFGTVRIIFVARGMKVLAPILGFFEVTTWLWAISQVMQNLGNIPCALAFAGGFALGNYLGILLEEKLALGTSLIRIVTSKDAGELVRNLNLNDFGVTCLDGQGATGPVQVLLTVVKRKEVDRVTSLIREFDPKVFYSIDEVQTVKQGVFPSARVRPGLIPNPFKLLRQSPETSAKYFSAFFRS